MASCDMRMSTRDVLTIISHHHALFTSRDASVDECRDFFFMFRVRLSCFSTYDIRMSSRDLLTTYHALCISIIYVSHSLVSFCVLWYWHQLSSNDIMLVCCASLMIHKKNEIVSRAFVSFFCVAWVLVKSSRPSHIIMRFPCGHASVNECHEIIGMLRVWMIFCPVIPVRSCDSAPRGKILRRVFCNEVLRAVRTQRNYWAK